MTKKKYILIGGYITNPKGRLHYVEPHRLVVLHKIKMEDVFCIAKNRDDERLRGLDSRNYTILFPREDGIYEDLSDD